MEKEIPKQVIEEAGCLVEYYGNNFRFLGKRDNLDVYQFMFPEDTTTGFPFIYMYNSENQTAYEITGFEAIDIIQELLED
ncbi:MAG: hypothetical protein IJV11_08100 [Muribaculaceae bacterium]|nr:hypothetical protein [Muribaculaceae bacterium]